MNARLIALAGLCLMVAAPTAYGAEAPPESGRSDVTNVAKSDPAMNAAIAEARRTLPQFLAALAKPPSGTGGYTFKYPLAGWEHIWVDEVARRGDRLVGKLANVPMQEGYAQGQEVSVPLKDVSDWAYRDATGVMRGHYTTRVLLPRLDPQQARQIRTAFRWTD